MHENGSISSESESSSSSQTSGATDSTIYYSAGRMYLSPDTWKGVSLRTVDALPNDKNGLCKYQLKFSINKRIESSRDGRHGHAMCPHD